MRITEANERIDLEDKMLEITAPKQNTEKKNRLKRKEGSLRDLWDNIKCTNIHIVRVPEEGEKRERT